MARAICIVNPGASRTRIRGPDIVASVFRRAGWSFDVLTTSGPDEVRHFAHQGVEAGVDQILVYGGDGTVMLAAAGVVGTGVPIGLLAGGTGNILAGNLRIPKNVGRAAKACLRGKTKTIDIGCVRRSDGPHYFAVAAGAGFDAMMMFGTPAHAKRRWGMLAYVKTALRILPGIRSPVHRLTVDGETMDVEAAMVLILNCSEFGSPLFRIGRGVQLDDGALDVFIARANGLPQVALAIGQLLVGKADGRGLVKHVQGASIEIRCDEQRPVELDGEAFGVTPLVAEVLPRGLTVTVP